MRQSIAQGLVGAVIAVVITGCATFGYSSGTYGPDSMVVQYTEDGRPSHCWKLRSTQLRVLGNGTLEWIDLSTRNTVHVTGRTSHVKVEYGNFDGAAKILGVEAARCTDGVYTPYGVPPLPDIR